MLVIERLERSPRRRKGLCLVSEEWNNGQEEMRTTERKPADERTTADPSLATQPLAMGTEHEGAFTRYVRALSARSEAVVELVDEVRGELRRALVRELRWRSLWSGSPAYIGILGWSSWTPGDTRGTASPLDDLLSDCYLFIFGQRLRQLLDQLRTHKKIDGLVIVFLRHFLTDLQKHHDPLGYRLFEMLCVAVRVSIATDQLHVLSGTPKIRNETVLGVSVDTDPGEVASVDEMRPLVVGWNDALLPGLVTADRQARGRITESLSEYLIALEGEGIVAFRFKDLLKVMKEDVRARWTGFHAKEGGETTIERDEEGVRQLVRILRPETRVEDLDGFKKLVRCVSNFIPKVEGRQKTRVYLVEVWNFLRHWSVDDQDSLPSNRQLEESLRIPRDRFAGLYETLGQLVRRCQGKFSGTVVKIGVGKHRQQETVGGKHG